MESLNNILEYVEDNQTAVQNESQNKVVSADKQNTNEVKSQPKANQNEVNDFCMTFDKSRAKNCNGQAKHDVIKLIKIYLKEFPEETKEWSKKAKDMDSLDDDQLEELKVNVIRSVNSVSSLDTIADNSVLVLNLYEYLMEPVFPVPGISASLGKNPAFKGTVKKILLKYLGTSLYTEMSPEFSLVAMVFQTSILCNAVADVNSKKIQAKNEEVCESVVKNIPPLSYTEDNFDDL